MTGGNDHDLSDFSMLDLFRMEVENHTNTLNDGLLRLENAPDSEETIESLMRSSHSIKGAARIVQIDAAVHLAHAMEDCFSAAKDRKIDIESTAVDRLLQGVDWLTRIAKASGGES